MDHRNARLTFLARVDLIREVEAGYSQAEVARRFRVCRSTVAKWVRCYRKSGTAGLEGSSCRPHRCPRQTGAELAGRIFRVHTHQCPEHTRGGSRPGARQSLRSGAPGRSVRAPLNLGQLTLTPPGQACCPRGRIAVENFGCDWRRQDDTP